MAIAIGETATMRSIDGIRSAILEAFHLPGEIELDVSALAEADLSFLQLVEAARKLAATEDRCLRLSAPANPVLVSVLERAGFLAGGNDDASNFWLKGGVADGIDSHR